MNPGFSACREACRAFLLDQPYRLAAADETALAELHRNGLIGVLAHQVKRHGHPDRVFASALKDLYKRAFFKWARYQALLEGLEPHLERAGLQLVLLKGSALARSVYPWPGLRPLSDLDILIRDEQRPELAALLCSQGWKASSDGLIFFDSQGRQIDLHGPDLGRAERFCGLDEGAVWTGCQPLEHSRVYRVLSPANGLAHLAVHALKHSYNRLIWLIDIALVTRTSQIQYPLHPAAEKALQDGLFLVGQLTGAPYRPRPPWLIRPLLASMPGNEQHPLGQLLLAWHQPDWPSRRSFFRTAVSQPAYDNAESGPRRWLRLLRQVATILTRVLF